MTDKEINFDTMAIHAGEETKPERALNNPIFMTSTFTFDNLKQAEDTFSFKNDDYVYTRGNNPTLKILENKMSKLEGGEAGVAFSSGMAAITSSLLAVAEKGQKIIAHQVLYGSTYNVIKKILPQQGYQTELVDLTNPKNLESSIDENTSAVYLETPANPNLEIIDIQHIVEIARKYNCRVVVDNTFATPYFQKPLKLGADIVVHSATKYISGHGDVIAGIAVGSDSDFIHRLKFEYLTEYGGVLSPFNGWLLIRGLKTLPLRMRQHEINAERVADFLLNHKQVKQVYYPGLEGHEGFEVAKKQMSGFGAMVSFELHGGEVKARKFLNKLKLIKLAVSLGDTETLIEYPFAMTHRGYSAQELHQMGLSKEMLRLSIGLEDVSDIIADLDKALQEG